MKTKALTDMQFLALLEKTLSKVTDDAQLASVIYQEVAKEVRMVKNIQAFEKFCEKGGLPDAEPATLEHFERELTTQFGEQSVEITKDEKGSTLEVAIELPDRVIKTKVKVDPALAEEEPVPAPFVPFPVCLAEDPELVWVLGRREDLGPDEASRALEKIQQEFWETKKGVELQRGGTEKCFAEFIIHVPAAALTDSGLKRHYKGAETLRTLSLQRGV